MYNQYMQPQFGRYMPEQPYNVPNNMQFQQLLQAPITKGLPLQGKIVDNVDVVKSMDIPLDGSVSYFPMADGSSIVTKQLQSDGTSKTIVYKPVEDKEEKVEYATKSDLKAILSDFPNEDIEDIKEELKELKKEIKAIKKDK